MRLISFVIPCYGSEKTITPVINEIIDVVSRRSEYDYEIIAVNDFSKDNVWQVLEGIAAENKKIRLINFAKNMNRPGAVMAGLRFSSGELVVIMDDDGQVPMDNLWKLVDQIDNGYDAAIAKYTEYKQSLFKSFGTAVNRKMTEIIIDKPKELSFTNFMLLRRFLVEEIVKYENPYPYLTGLILRSTDRIINVPMEERERIAGSTTFTFSKMVKLWLNGLTAFSIKPLRIASFIGILAAISGFIFGLVTIIRKFVVPNISVGWSSIVAILLFMGGLIMVMLGIIGEYIGRIYISLNNSPQYVIKQTVNFDTDQKDKSQSGRTDQEE